MLTNNGANRYSVRDFAISGLSVGIRRRESGAQKRDAEGVEGREGEGCSLPQPTRELGERCNL